MPAPVQMGIISSPVASPGASKAPAKPCAGIKSCKNRDNAAMAAIKRVRRAGPFASVRVLSVAGGMAGII